MKTYYTNSELAIFMYAVELAGICKNNHTPDNEQAFLETLGVIRKIEEGQDTTNEAELYRKRLVELNPSYAKKLECAWEINDSVNKERE